MTSEIPGKIGKIPEMFIVEGAAPVITRGYGSPYFPIVAGVICENPICDGESPQPCL